jgi:hypothetical protein
MAWNSCRLSAVRSACSRAKDSVCLSPLSWIEVRTEVWSSASRAHKATASVMVSRPALSSDAACSQSRLASNRREVTQLRFFPHKEEMVLGPSLCSWRSAQTTRASSMAQTVRCGQLA